MLGVNGWELSKWAGITANGSSGVSLIASRIGKQPDPGKSSILILEATFDQLQVPEEILEEILEEIPTDRSITIRDPSKNSIQLGQTSMFLNPRSRKDSVAMGLILFGILLAEAVSDRPVASAAERPHIVMAFADDWGKYASIYGKLEPGGINDYVSTPNFDRVAEEGFALYSSLRQRPVLHAVSKLAAFRTTLLALWERCDLAGSDLGPIDSKLSVAA